MAPILRRLIVSFTYQILQINLQGVENPFEKPLLNSTMSSINLPNFDQRHLGSACQLIFLLEPQISSKLRVHCRGAGWINETSKRT